MQRLCKLASSLPRTVSKTLSSPSSVKGVIPGQLLKGGSLDFVRTSKFASGFSPLEVKPLNSIMDVERAKYKSPEDLAMVWDDFHLGRGHIGASMKTSLYRLFEQRAADCQYFVIPLWRGSGYTTMFSQVKSPHMIFTGLEDYKARGTQASPYFTVTHYTEFADSKDWYSFAEMLFLLAS
ncbi:ATP synthase mitochondrial F1 complex assembly factor 1 [Bienertia sinuspersici]